MKILFIGGGIWGSEILNGLAQTNNQILSLVRLPASNYLANSLRKAVFYLPVGHKVYSNFRRNKFYETIWRNKIKPYFTDSANNSRFMQKITSAGVDLVIMASNSEVLSRQWSKLPKYGCVNCHPSLLPAYRGPNPFSKVILNKEAKTGITFHKVNSRLDAGDILMQREVKVEDEDNAQSLALKCAQAAVSCLPELLAGLQHGTLKPRPQDELYATYFSELKDEELLISWENEAQDIYNLWRAAYPWRHPYTRSCLGKIFLSRPQLLQNNNSRQSSYPGEILDIDSENIVIMASDCPLRFRDYRINSLNKSRTYHLIVKLMKKKSYVKLGE